MGCGAAVARPTTNLKKTPNATDRQPIPKPQTAEGNENGKIIHFIDVVDGPLRKDKADIQCGDTMVFRTNLTDQYDIFDVYKYGDNYYRRGDYVREDGYYRIVNGYGLCNLNTYTPEDERCIPISLDFNQNQPEIDLYFCVIPSSEREKVLNTRECPKFYCERNRLTIKKRDNTIHLTDKPDNQRVDLHKGDTIEIDWASDDNIAYRIEEKKYCPISGGLYTVEKTSHKALSKGKYTKTFNELGMSFLFRLTDKNQIHDIIVCVIKYIYTIKQIEIIDNRNQPNIISIERTNWLLFEWNSEIRQTIEIFDIDGNKQQLIELHEPIHRGSIYHQFKETGVYCYKTADNQIGTIIVEPLTTIHQVQLFSDTLIQKMNTKDLVQFNWRSDDSLEEPVFFTIDKNSSVIPKRAGDLNRIFDCPMHKCRKLEPFFRRHFHICETFLLNIPQHGLYNFAYSSNPDNVLISLVVERGIHTHNVTYNEENIFEPRSITINCSDQVLFTSSSSSITANIYHTDEFRNQLEAEKILFQHQQNSINYFMKDFRQEGIYYFSTDIKNHDRRRPRQSSTYSFAIIVLPEIKFHYKLVCKGNPGPRKIITTHINDFMVWEFEQIISNDLIRLRPDETFKELISCHDRAIVGKKRRCFAVECIQPGASFFSNPDFERATGLYHNRLISTIIIDPPFSQNSFMVTNQQFIPNILCIAKNDTVSWILKDNQPNHGIYVQSNESNNEDYENNFINQNVAEYVDGVFHHLHTFNQPGKYIIKSDRFQSVATVIVYSDSQMRQVEEPNITQAIDHVTQIDTKICLDCGNHRNTKIYYTLDGSPPTRWNDNVHLYDSNIDKHWVEPGLHVLRAYSTEDQKISSSIIASGPTFVMRHNELESSWNTSWNSFQITLSGSFHYPNKIYGNIEIKPRGSIDRVDYFELYIDNIPQKMRIPPNNAHHSADLIPSHDEQKFEIDVPPGKHQCYLKVILKDKNQEAFKSNIIEIYIPPIDGKEDEEIVSHTSTDTSTAISNRVTTTSDKVTQTSNEVIVDPLITRPLLKVTRVGLQMASLSWNLDDSVNQVLIKGYRIILNSEPGEILPPNQREYELRDLKPGTTNVIQVSVTSDPDFVNQKISEPIRIVCPQRPRPPVIQAVQAEKPFSIGIKWKIDTNDQDEINSFKIFLDGKPHEEIETNGRQSFKYNFTKLQAEQTYSIYVKAVIEHKKLDGYAHQCDIESIASNELLLKCAVPPKGIILRIGQIDGKGIEMVWDTPDEYGNVKFTGYQILKDGRAIGNPLPLDERRFLINDLELGKRYVFQVLPITNPPDGTILRIGETYDPERHGPYLPGPKFEVEYTDLVEPPKRIWIENISGHSAMVCWSPVDESSSSNIQPDSYKLSIWNNKDFTRDKPKIVLLTKDKSSAHLKDLQSSTTYEFQLEAYKRRRHQTTNDLYIVSTKSDILTFETGSPPDPPSNLYLIACTNTDARIGFDPFIEHNAEIKALRVSYEPVSSEQNTKEISIEISPDKTEFILSNLIQRTDYNVTIYGITEEYLNENRCRDTQQLPKKLKPSNWLPNKNLQFKTSGCEPVSKLNIRQSTTQSIELDWILPKVYGSTQYIGQILRWKLEHGGEEHSKELDRNIKNTTIRGTLPSGLYKISLDSLFSVKINLQDDSDETSRKEKRLTITESTSVRFHIPAACERPEVYLTGYTTNTIDLIWNKPNMFNVIHHPEKIDEKLRIHRRLVGYRIDINGRKHKTLDEDQYQCTLTECQPGEKYEVQLVALTTVQNEYMNDTITNDKEHGEKPDETPSKKLRVRMLKNQDLLPSFQINFKFNYNQQNKNTTDQSNEIESIGKINVQWQVSDPKNILHFILQWYSSKDLRIQQKTIASNETSATIDSCDEKYYYVIEIIIVTNDRERHQYQQLTIPIPGVPDAPELWHVKTTITSFTVEWSEPKSYGIPIIGFQLYIEGKKKGDMIEANLRRAEISSRINRTYQVNVCAITNNSLRPQSIMSEPLFVITTPTTDLIPTIHYPNNDGTSTPFYRNIARIISLQIESVNEETLHLDWTSFLSTAAIRAYYIHYTCLNNGDIQVLRVSKRFRHTVLRGLRPGFTYGLIVMAVDKNGGVLYTSDKRTVQMNAPPNAPIVSISEREVTHVKLEWRPAASYGEVAVVGYKIFVNNRLAAILRHDQLTYTLTNGVSCDVYTVDVQTLSNEKNIVSPMSRTVSFTWPGIKPGAFRRMDDEQTGIIIVAWEHPQLEDEKEKLIKYKLFSENLATHAERLHGEYDATTQQAIIYDLNNGQYRLWLEIQSEKYCVRSRPIKIMSGRFISQLNRETTPDSAKCFMKKQKRLRSRASSLTTPSFRHTQNS